MSRKNRNARRQNTRSLNAKGIQMSMPETGPDPEEKKLHMVDEKCGYEFTHLSCMVLESDITYQRPIDEKRVARIVENFDHRLANPLKVSNRDGHFYVFDGAHTLAALKEVSKFDNFMVPCMVFHGLTYEDEAYLFALQRGESKEVAAAYRIRALILSNDARACDFRSRTEAPGFRLAPSGRTASKCTLGCIAKLWKIYESDPELYTETLSVLMGAWHGEIWSLNANIVGGLAMFISVFRGQYNTARFLKHVGGTDLTELKKYKDSTAKNKDYSFAFAMFRLYNRIGGTGTLSPCGCDRCGSCGPASR